LSVLETQPPRFTSDEVALIADEVFGVKGRAVDLGSERDATYLIDDGADGAVLKISNLGEDAAVLELEQAAIAHVTRVDPELPVARPLHERGTYGGHHVRLFERLHGRTGDASLDDDAVYDFAATHARVNLALRSFFHRRRVASCSGTSGTRRSSGVCSTRSTTPAGARSLRA
jgi:Ser/Thr protein kinase RdoA (MazF antagonist)